MVFLKKIVTVILVVFNLTYGSTQGMEYYEDDPPEYDFSYHVYDPYSRLDFGHFETKNLHRTKGKYFVLLPDGRMQTVTYFADASGYHPVVSYEKPRFSDAEQAPVRTSVLASHRQITDPIRSSHARKLTASSSEYNVVSNTLPGPSADISNVPNTLFTNLDTGQKQPQFSDELESSSSTSREITNLDSNEKNYNYQQTNIPEYDYQIPSIQKSIQKGSRDIKSYVSSFSKELAAPKIKNHIRNFINHASNDNNSPERRREFTSNANSNRNKISIDAPLNIFRNDKINIQTSEYPQSNNYKNTDHIFDDGYRSTISNSNSFDEINPHKNDYEEVVNAHNENLFPNYESNSQTPSQIPSPPEIILAPNSKQSSMFVNFPENYPPDIHEDEKPFDPNTFGISYVGGVSVFKNNDKPAFSFSVIGKTPSIESHDNTFTSLSNSFPDNFSKNNNGDEENDDIYIPTYNSKAKNNFNPIVSNPGHDNSNSNHNFNFAFNNFPNSKNKDFNSNIQPHVDRFPRISQDVNSHQKNSNFVFINHGRLNKTPFPIKNIGTSNLLTNLNLPSTIKENNPNFVFMKQPVVPKPNTLPRTDLATPLNKDIVVDDKSSYTSHTSYGRNRFATQSKNSFGSGINSLSDAHITTTSEVPLTSTYTDIGPVFPPPHQHIISSSPKNNANQRLGGTLTKFPEESTIKSVMNDNINDRLTTTSKTRFGSVTNFVPETQISKTSEVPLTSTYTDTGPVFPPSQQHLLSLPVKSIVNQSFGQTIAKFPEKSTAKSEVNDNFNIRLTTMSKTRIGSVTNFDPENQIATTSEVPLTSTYTDIGPVFPPSQQRLISSSFKNSVNQRFGATTKNIPEESTTKSITNVSNNSRMKTNFNFFDREFASNKNTHIKFVDNPKKIQNKVPEEPSDIVSHNQDISSSSNNRSSPKSQMNHEQDVNISHEITSNDQRRRKNTNQVIKLHNLLDPKFFPNKGRKEIITNLPRFTHNQEPKTLIPMTISVTHITEVGKADDNNENAKTGIPFREVLTPPNFNFFKHTGHGMQHPFQDPRFSGSREPKVTSLLDDQLNIRTGMHHPFQDPRLIGSREVIDSQDNHQNVQAPKPTFNSKPFEFNLFSNKQPAFSPQSNILNNGHSGSFEVDPDASVVPRVVPVIIPVEDERISKNNKNFSDHDYGQQSGDYLDDDYL